MDAFMSSEIEEQKLFQLHQRFLMFDSAGSGSVDGEEFYRLMGSLGFSLTKVKPNHP